MLVSIIIPVYNRENFIEQCLNSIIRAYLCDYEIILVDDNSTDKSKEICKEYTLQYDFVKLYELGKNVGPGMAREFGIKHSNGEFIYFVDSDDTIVTSKLPMLFEILKNNRNTDIFCFNHNLLYENGEMKNVNTFKSQGKVEIDLFFKNYPHCLTLNLWASIFSRKFILQNNIVNYNCSFLEDAMFASQAFLKAKEIYTIDETFYNYRYFSNNSLMKSLEYDGRRKGIITFARNLISCEGLIDSEPKKISYNYAFYSIAMRLLLLAIENNKLTLDFLDSLHLKLDFKKIFQEFNEEEIPNMLFRSMYEKIKKCTLDFTKKLYFAPAGIFSLAIAKELQKTGVKVEGFLDNNPENSPYSQNAIKSGFSVSSIESTNLTDSVVAITHTTLATVELSAQLEKRGFVKNKDFICFI